MLTACPGMSHRASIITLRVIMSLTALKNPMFCPVMTNCSVKTSDDDFSTSVSLAHHSGHIGFKDENLLAQK